MQAVSSVESVVKTSECDETPHNDNAGLTESPTGQSDPAEHFVFNEGANEARRALLEAATIPGPAPRWARGGTERLYFDHPVDMEISGLVEIDTGESPVRSARLELIAPVDVAEKVIKFVIGLAREVPVEAPVEVVVVETPIAATREPSPGEADEEDTGLPPELDFEAPVEAERCPTTDQPEPSAAEMDLIAADPVVIPPEILPVLVESSDG